MVDENNLVRIFIADDHPIFRDAIKTLLTRETECRVVGEACDGDETLVLISEHKPDILLLDMSMQKVSGMEVLESLAGSKNGIKTIVLGELLNQEEISRIFQLQACGFVMKESSSQMLINSIKAVMAGKYWIGHEAVSNPTKRLKNYKKSTKSLAHNNYRLTPREMDVCREVVGGYRNKEIAGRLGISEQTVKHHITHIFDKLGVYNRLELTLFVFHNRIVEN
jgi:two-component system nitrate/nitrite response regulator NarL